MWGADFHEAKPGAAGAPRAPHLYTLWRCRTHNLYTQVRGTWNRDEDPSSLTDLYIYDEYRRKCIAKVDETHQSIMSMPKAQLKGVCKKFMETPAQLKGDFTGQLKTLKVRLKRTTNERRAAVNFVRTSIRFIWTCNKNVMDAGIAGIDAVQFCRYEEGKARLDF